MAFLRRGVDVRAPSSRIPAALQVLLVPGTALVCACATRGVPAAAGPQAYYQTAYPTHDLSRELAAAFASVKQVHYTAEYVTYLFTEAAGITENEVRAGNAAARADTSYRETVSKSGTAAILARSGDRLTLLTTHHVVSFPPLRIEFYDDRARPGRAGTTPRRVASASYRTAERGILVPNPSPGAFDVVARDERSDLALLELELGTWSDTSQFPILELALGDPRRLSWGSVVFVMGFPRGYPMVTRAIVSNPDWDRRGAFLTDGLWNEGISGGLILAVRGETGALEPVGLARAGAGEREFRLQPDTAGIPPGSVFTQLYTGALYLESALRIQYGITLSVSMTQVTDFLERNRARLRTRGLP